MNEAAPPVPFSPEDFSARARARLSSQPPDPRIPPPRPPRGDFILNPYDLEDETLIARARPAAVLIPAVMRPEGVTLLLTQRHTRLQAHSGQVAFPGGKIDPGDASSVSAALREAQEEVGLEPRFATPVGCLDPYLTRSGYNIVPVVAEIDPAFVPVPNADEVEAVFETPLSFLMNPASHERRSRQFMGRERHFYVMPHGGWNIWGVTAGIIRALYERLYL